VPGRDYGDERTRGSGVSGRDYGDRNRAVWDVVAAKYAADVDADVAALVAGRTTLFDYEVEHIGGLKTWCKRAIVLQCSHGQDALSLWTLGAAEIVGIDFSARMLAVARRKSELLGAPATWVEADALDVPAEFNGTADLVYTGKGALPWIADLNAWAQVVARLLRPGGRMLLTEGHPLDWVWDVHADTFRMDPGSGGYFARQPVPNRDFPQSACRRLSPSDDAARLAVEYQWTTARIVNAVLEAGLVLDRLDEHARPYWDKFPHIPKDELELVPHVLVVVAHTR